MSSILCLTIHFLDAVPRFHGRNDEGNPEWPPSPLRLFQALVCASAMRGPKHRLEETALPALRWLGGIQPSIVAPRVAAESFGYRMYVPNNSGDLMTSAWARGNPEASMTSLKLRVEKDVRPTTLCDGDSVRYLYPLANGDCPHFDVLLAAARSITHLGWGIDMVAGNASILTTQEAAELSGERWSASDDDGGVALRVPTSGTLDDLSRKHAAFLSRIQRDTDGGEFFRPVPPITAFRVTNYRRTTDVAAPAFRAFSILKPDGSKPQPFDTVRKSTIVAGMMRHAASSESVVRSLGTALAEMPGFLHGHGEVRGEPHAAVTGPRLAYLPLPSLEYRGAERGSVVGDVRRALITVVGGEAEQALQRVSRSMSGTALVDEQDKKERAILSLLPNSDKMVRNYTRRATTWSTVTPVILPGYDDPRNYRRRLFTQAPAEDSQLASQEQIQLLAKLDKRVEHLLRKAIRQAGYSEELAQNAGIEWRKTGFRAGNEPATRYFSPNTLRRFRRLHARITWRDASGSPIEVPGPICLGAGRFIGLGLFAAEND